MSDLRRRIFGVGTPDSTPASSRDASPAPTPGDKDGATGESYKVVPADKLDKSKADVEDLKKQAAARGRQVSVLTTCFVVCRPTLEEAEAYLKYYADQHADWDAVDRMINLLFAFSKSLGKEAFKGLRDRVAAGHGSYPLIGTPKQIADELIKMHEVGLNGTTIAFVDYEAEFPYFRDEVLPLLEQAGLRTPVAG